MSGTARKLVSGASVRVATTLATALVSLLMMPFVVHTLGDHNYGIWALVASVIGYYDLLELGLSSAVTRFIASGLGKGDEEQCNQVFNTALRIYFGLGGVVLLATGIVLFLAPWFCKTKEDTIIFRHVALVLGASTALQFPLRVFRGVLQAHLRFDRVASLDLLTLALRTTFIIGALLRGYGVVALAWATFFCGLPSMVLCVQYAFRELPFLRFDRQFWQVAAAKALFSYSLISMVTVLANILRFQVDNVVVGAFLGFAAVTHYRVAGTLCQYYLSLISSIAVFSPLFSRKEGAKDYEGIKNIFLFTTKISIGTTSFITFGFIAWGHPFIARWMGRQYLDAYPVLVVLALAFYLNLAQLPGVGLLYGTSRHKFLAVQSSVEGVVNLLLSLWLVRRYGMVGVALGTLIPTVISKLFIQPVYVCRVAGITVIEFGKKMTKLLMAVTGSLAIPLLLSLRFASPDYKALFTVGMASVILYASGLWLSGFSRAETALVKIAIWPRLAGKTAAD